MSDGSSSGLGGILFEAGKTVTDQVGQIGSAVVQQISGKNLTGGTSSAPKNLPFSSQNVDQITDVPTEKISAGNKSQQSISPQNQQSYQQMILNNERSDSEKIAELTRELHYKIYGKGILKPEEEENSLAKQRERRAQQEVAEINAENENRAASAQSEPVVPGQLGGNLGSPQKPVQSTSDTEVGKGVQ